MGRSIRHDSLRNSSSIWRSPSPSHCLESAVLILPAGREFSWLDYLTVLLKSGGRQTPRPAMIVAHGSFARFFAACMGSMSIQQLAESQHSASTWLISINLPQGISRSYSRKATNYQHWSTTRRPMLVEKLKGTSGVVISSQMTPDMPLMSIDRKSVV